MSSNSQYEVLRPFVTEHIQSLVRGRLLEGLRFFEKHGLRKGFTWGDVKLALLLVKLANPDEPLSVEEAEHLKKKPQAQTSLKESVDSHEASSKDTQNSLTENKSKKRV